MYNIFILGAGFSKPAGLPLGNELFADILKLANIRGLYEYPIQRDVQDYLAYSNSAKGTNITENEINLEEFISYLDIEHFLQLKGNDHWSQEGNKTQIVLRNLIALAIHQKQMAISDESYQLYEQFVENLEPNDFVITFNYDTILETALERKNIPYRLFPNRLKKNEYGSFYVDDSNEVIVYKMHGSINWFDISYYQHLTTLYPNTPHLIFNSSFGFTPSKIVDGIYHQDSPLQKIYKIKNLSEYFFRSNLISEVPLIVSPSFSKIVYLNPLIEYWRGFNKAGIMQNRVAIIGFSLPEHDEYIRQPIHRLVDNFHNDNPLGLKKSKLKMIDYRLTENEIGNYKQRYSFIDWGRTDAYFNGFDNQAIDLIFQD